MEVKELTLDNGIKIPVTPDDYPWLTEWDWRWDTERDHPVAGPKDKPLLYYTEVIRMHWRRGGKVQFLLPSPSLVTLMNRRTSAFGYFRKFQKQLVLDCMNYEVLAPPQYNTYGFCLGRALTYYLEQGSPECKFMGDFLHEHSSDIGGPAYIDILCREVIAMVGISIEQLHPRIKTATLETIMRLPSFDGLVGAIVGMICNYQLQ